MTFAHFSFSLSTWRTRLFAALLLSAISGCYVPVPYYDFSNLGDNVVDASIKKHFYPYAGIDPFVRYRQGSREDFLAAFPLGSSSEAAVSYLTSIGGRCRVESQVKGREIDRCEFEKNWKQYSKHLLSKEFTSDKVANFNYVIESSSDKIADVVVDFKMSPVNRRAD